MEEWPLVRSLTSGENVVDEEYFNVLPDGSRLVVRCSSSPIYDDEGRIVAGVLVMHDVTEHNRAEERLGYLSGLLDHSDDAEETLVRISSGPHADARLGSGELNAALARTVVRLHKDYVGRGPMKAQAFFRDNVIVVLMHDVMTRAERSLASRGQHDAVLGIRRRFQRTIRPDLVAAVERLTGCKVTAFMGDNHIDPDMAVEVFVLDRPLPAREAGTESAPRALGR